MPLPTNLKDTKMYSRKFGNLKPLVIEGNAVLAIAKSDKNAVLVQAGAELVEGMLARTLHDFRPEGKCWEQPEFFIVGNLLDNDDHGVPVVISYHVEKNIHDAVRWFKELSQVQKVNLYSEFRDEAQEREQAPSPVRILLKNGVAPQ